MDASPWACVGSALRSAPQVSQRPAQSGRQSGAIGSARETASRMGSRQVELVVVVEPERVGLGGAIDGLAAVDVDGRQGLLVDGHLDRGRDRAQAAAALLLEGRPHDGLGEDAPTRPRQPHLAVERRGQADVLGDLEAVGVDRVAGGSCPAPRAAARPRCRSASRQTAASWSSSTSALSGSSGWRSSSMSMPRRMPCRSLTTSSSRPTRTDAA